MKNRRGLSTEDGEIGAQTPTKRSKIENEGMEDTSSPIVDRSFGPDNAEGFIVEEQTTGEQQVVQAISDANKPVEIVRPEGQTKPEPWQQSLPSPSERLKYVFEHSEFSDCSVIVGVVENQKMYNLHKLVLCMTSDKFMSLVSEAAHAEVLIPDIEPETFEVLLQYMYLNSLVLPSVEVACKVFKAALDYNMLHALCLAKQYALEYLNPQNLWDVFELAVKSNDKDLKLGCASFLSKYPSSWKRLPVVSHALLKEVLSIEPLGIEEIDVLKAVDEWASAQCIKQNIDVNADNKRKFIGPEILSKIRFLLIPPQDFLEFCCHAGSTQNSFLKMEEIFPILANLNVPGSVSLPAGISSSSVPRGGGTKYQMFRVSRQTVFKFCVKAHSTCKPDAYAISCPAQNSSIGVRNFSSSILVSDKVLLHGIQVPTLWYPPLVVSGSTDYEETYQLAVSDSQNNILAKAATSIKVSYASVVDLFLKENVELKPNEEYRIFVSTRNTYHLTKKFRPVEVEKKVKFAFRDFLTHRDFRPIHHGTPDSDAQTDYGFILQIIFSLI